VEVGVPESPLEAYLRSKGLPLPQPMDSFSTLPQGPPPPTMKAASGNERIQNAVAEALGLPSWAPNLQEGSYGLPPSMRAPTAGEGLQDDLLAALDALIQQPVAQAGLAGLDVTNQITEALGGMPNYEPGGGPDKMMSMATVDIPGAPGKLNFGRELPELLKRTGSMRYQFRQPSLNRFEELLKVGAERPADWMDTDALLNALGQREDLLYKWHRGWGATSPGTDFVQNTREANRALARYQEGRPFDWDWMGENRFTNRGAKQGNLNRAYYTDEPLTSGRELQNKTNPEGVPIVAKVNAMADFMAGRPRIPIDRHALDAAGTVMPANIVDTEMKLDPLLAQLRQRIYADEAMKRGGLTTTQLYDILEQAYAGGLGQVAPNMDLRQAFAQLWEGVRGAKGLGHYGGTNDVLRGMGLFEPNAMLDPATLYGRSVPMGGAKARRALEALK